MLDSQLERAAKENAALTKRLHIALVSPWVSHHPLQWNFCFFLLYSSPPSNSVQGCGYAKKPKVHVPPCWTSSLHAQVLSLACRGARRRLAVARVGDQGSRLLILWPWQGCSSTYPPAKPWSVPDSNSLTGFAITGLKQLRSQPLICSS